MTDAGNSIFGRLEQLVNAWAPITVNEVVDILTSLKLWQPENESFPIEETEVGISISFNALHSLNALSGIVVTADGSVTFVKFSQHVKSDSPISVTVDGRVISVNESQCENVNGSIFVTADDIVASLSALQFVNK